MEDDIKPVRMRRRLDEQSWQALLERFDGAAMTVQEFCAREGLTRSSFFLWRSRLRADPIGRPAPAQAKSAALAAKPSFLDLGLLGAVAPEPAAPVPAAPHAGLDLRIELGGGLSLHLVRR